MERHLSKDPIHIPFESESKENLPVLLDTRPKVNKFPLGFSYAESYGANPIPIILFLLLASSREKDNAFYKTKKNVDTYGGENDYGKEDDDVLSDTENPLINILSSVYPYLDFKYREGISFLLGINEIRRKLDDLLNGVYKPLGLPDTKIMALGYKEKAHGIIKAMQPYISLENQTLINKILNTDKAMEKLMEITSNLKMMGNAENIDDSRAYTSRVLEIIDIIKVIVPAEQLANLGEIENILKIIHTVDLARSLKPDEGKIALGEKEPGKSPKAQENPSEAIKEKPGPKSGLPKDNLANISKAIGSILGPNKDGSLDLILKMAQLLSSGESEEKGKEA